MQDNSKKNLTKIFGYAMIFAMSKYQTMYEKQKHGWTPFNEMAYIDVLRNQRQVNEIFSGRNNPPTSEQLLENYRVSFKKRFVNRTFPGWETKDYKEIERYIDDSLT